MNDAQELIKTMAKLQLIIAKEKLTVCEESTKTNRYLHIKMLKVEIELLTQFTDGL